MKIRPLLAVCPTHYCDNVDDGKHEWLPLVEVLFATSASSPVSTTSQKLGLDFRRFCQRLLSIWNCHCVGDEDNNLIFKFQFCPPMKPGSILTSSCNFSVDVKNFFFWRVLVICQNLSLIASHSRHYDINIAEWFHLIHCSPALDLQLDVLSMLSLSLLYTSSLGLIWKISSN